MTLNPSKGIAYSLDSDGNVWHSTFEKGDDYFNEFHYDDGYSRELDDYSWEDFTNDIYDDDDLRDKKIERRRRLQRRKDRIAEHRVLYPHLYAGVEENPIYRVLKNHPRVPSYLDQFMIQEKEEEPPLEMDVVSQSSSQSPEIIINNDHSPPIIVKESAFEEIAIAKRFMVKSNTINEKPIERMTLHDIADRLSCHVLYQEDATDDIAHKVVQCTESVLTKHDTNTPFNIILSGASGVGKTQSIKELREVFQMGVNQVNEDAYIEYRFGDMTDESASNFITGAPPGYLGHASTTCLYDLLKKAVAHYEKIAKQEEDEEDKEISTTTTTKKKSPYIILIFFDEIDKGNKKLMNTLNSLLSDGKVSNYAKNEQFVVPRNTRLLVCSTANFGEEQMVVTRAKMNDFYEEAKGWIKNEMSVRGYAPCDISRMGDVIPFFPPSKRELSVILIKRFYENMMKNAFSSRFGLANIDDEDVMKFINSMLERYDENGGIRDAFKFLDTELSAFSHQSMTHFDKVISSNQVLPLNPPAQIQFESIPYSDNLSKDLLVESHPTIGIACQNRFNSKRITKRLKSKSAIDYFTVSHPSVKEPSVNILAPVIYNDYRINNKFYVNHHHHHDNSPFLRQLLNQRDLANNSLNEIENVLQSSSPDKPIDDVISEIGNIIKKAKAFDIASSSLSLTSSSSLLLSNNGNSSRSNYSHHTSTSSFSFDDDEDDEENEENKEKERIQRDKLMTLKRKIVTGEEEEEEEEEVRGGCDDDSKYDTYIAGNTHHSDLYMMQQECENGEDEQRLTNFIHDNYVKMASKSISSPPLQYRQNSTEEEYNAQYRENEKILRSYEKAVESKHECPICYKIKALSQFKRTDRHHTKRRKINDVQFHSSKEGEISLDCCNSCRVKMYKNKG
jgi:hypothetical protein